MPRKTAPHQRYQPVHMEDFHSWVKENTNCLPHSRYSSQVASNLAKFLYFSSERRPFNDRTVWQHVYNPEKIDAWIRLLQSAGLSPTTLYNHLTCLNTAGRFCFVKKNLRPPRGFDNYLQAKIKLFRRRRRAADMAHIEQQEIRGTRSLGPLHRLVLASPTCTERMVTAINAAKTFLEQGGHALTAEHFLFAMRFAVMHVMASVAARPSAIYTLTVNHVEMTDANWSDGSPVIIKNQQHKTGGSCGTARLVLSGKGKMVFALYCRYMRPAAMANWSINCQYVFFNTAGNPLSPSTFVTNIRTLQRELGVQEQYCATDIRKAVTTKLRRRNNGDGSGASRLASLLCHSVATSNRHYQVGHRDQDAIDMHLAITRLIEEEAQQ